ncbi:MAG TPA: hypothetical protein VFU49_03455 [Ktedonobacteraceae bacterium]|nr:hypothetical protein [Ktedonobacteraceae bacterium]
MNDLGLVSVMPSSMIISLLVMMISFCLALQQPRPRTSLLLLHIVLLIVMLYGVTGLVEEAPRFNIVYRHEGYTEYIMRTGTVDPYLDAYFNWPGFFVLTAFITRISGLHDILSYADLAPVFYNLIYLGPLYVIFTTFTNNKRLIWLSVWIFYITNWIGQDYISPQGLFFFVYLLIMAILLKWFKRSPDATNPRQPRSRRHFRWFFAFWGWLTTSDTIYTPLPAIQRAGLLLSIIIMFAFMTYSHQLTPFFVLIVLIPLMIVGHITRKLWWLPCLMLAMVFGWLFIMAQPYLMGHSSNIFGSLGNILNSFNANVSSRVGGDPQHTFITKLRLFMPLGLWGLAFVGAIFRLLKGHRDATIVIMALTPFPLFIAQPYGGEMLLRCYLFSQPPMVFLCASIFYEVPSFVSSKRLRWIESIKGPISRLYGIQGIAISCLLIVFMTTFLYTRYGNELMDYKTYDEVRGIVHLYDIAAPKSLFVEAWHGSPWQIQDFEKFSLLDMSIDPGLSDAVGRSDVSYVVSYLRQHRGSETYIFFTRTQFATFDGTSGFPAGGLQKFESALQASGDFNLVYRTRDVQIFQLISDVRG